MGEEYFIEVIRDKSICPRCKTDTHADRVPRSWLVKLFFGWLPVKRYMCYRCKRKYYTVEKSGQTNSKSVPMMK